ncbi:MAG: O-antigen ligase family protein, partial [Usitatibacteraceae bacterium]
FEASQHKLLPLLLMAMCAPLVFRGWAGGVLALLADYGPTVILFFLLSTSIDTVAQHERAIRALAILTVVLAIHGIEQSWTGVGWSGATLSQGTRITYVGIFSDPNDLALAFVIALPMLTYASTEAKSGVGRAFWVACTAITTYGIFLTNSRGGMLGAIALFLVYVQGRFGMLKTSLIAILGLLGLAMLPTRLNELDAKEESAADRIESWGHGIQMLRENPMLGVGKGNYTEYHHLTAHNSFVLVFAELGLVGYFLWLSFVALSLYMVYRITRTSSEPEKRATLGDGASWAQYQKISKTYLHAMIGFLICAFFLSRSYVILLVILCAMCVALYQSVRHRWPTFAPITFGTVAIAVLFVQFGSIFIIYAVVRFLS